MAGMPEQEKEWSSGCKYAWVDGGAKTFQFWYLEPYQWSQLIGQWFDEG